MAELINYSTDLQEKREHLECLADDLDKLFISKEASDLTLMIKSKKFYCHKAILAARSKYFRTLLFENMEEPAQSEIELNEISSEAFEFVLKHIYTGIIDMTTLKLEIILHIIQIAHQYQLERLEMSVIYYVEVHLSFSIVFIVFEKALLFNMGRLEDACYRFVDDYADEFINHHYLISLPFLKKFLCRDSFYVKEIDLFRAICKWIDHNRPEQIEKQDVLDLVRLPLINAQDMVSEVWPSNLFPNDTILKAMNIRFNSYCEPINYRGLTVLEENVAIEAHKSEVILENFITALYESDICYGIHVTISLGKPFVTNCVKIHRNGHEANNKSFYAFEKSDDGINWICMRNYVERFISPGCLVVQYPATVTKRFSFRIDLNQLQNDSDLFVECMYTNNQPGL